MATEPQGFSVAGKVALVTGANRGIGKAIVEALVSHGAAKVYLAVRDVHSTAALEQRFGVKVQTVALDLASESALAQLACQCHDVELLVNNAGVAQTCGVLAEDMIATLQRQMEVNVYGLIRMAQAFAPQLQACSGALVQLNSVASLRSNDRFASYCASKAASYSVTQALRKQWLGKVQLLSVHPGPIATDMVGDLGLTSQVSPSDVAEQIIAALHTGQFHLYPDPFSQSLASHYHGYAQAVVEA
ncbi:SDR family oxidoreductase [Ferrimonas senticii]|uniref:SDR family oxidoreductase n=1 Tax=Ferrimonas senticii TaxID=394566 RepID=UPI00042A7269|nr:SDR family oxidoreductase [Ferrimonas senticii]